MSRKASRSYQLTIRLAGPVAERVRRVAKAESISLNQAVVRLLERGVDRRPGTQIGNRLDRFCGLLSKQEAAEITKAVGEEFDRIEPEFWK